MKFLYYSAENFTTEFMKYLLSKKFTLVTVHEYLGHGKHAVVENDGYGLGQVGFSMKLSDSPDSVCES